MRDIHVRHDHVSDPMTGSELVYEAFDTSKEGGFVYRFLFRENPGEDATDFRVLLSGYTSLEIADHRRREGLPELATGLEEYQYLKEFAETHGKYFQAKELDLRDDGPLSAGASKSTPGCWLVDWEKIPAETARTLVETLARTLFLARSRRPDGAGFYPDHLTVKPYHMPGQFVVRARANEFLGKHNG